MLSESLKAFHEKVYVITIESAADRRRNVVEQLGERNFEFVYSLDKRDVTLEQLIADGTYDEAIARRTDRRNKAMTLGHICCSIGHRRVYEKFLESGAERALVFEDDMVAFDVAESEIGQMIANVPPDADLIYWGWEGGGYAPWYGGIKQVLYHVQHTFALERYDHTMIRNLYAQPFNEHFDRAGKHFLAHAYTINRRAAEALISWNTPIRLNGDNALLYAVLNGDVNAYVARKQLYGQRSADKSDPMQTLTST